MSPTAHARKPGRSRVRGNWIYAIPVAMLVTGLMFTYKFATELETQAEARQAKDFHERRARSFRCC